MKKLIWLFVLILYTSLILTSTTYVKGAHSIWYVATTGSDAAAGDISHPFETIQRAVDVAQAGDTIYIRGGTYNQKVSMMRSGTAGQPITIAGYTGELAIIDGTDKLSTYDGIIYLNGQDYLTFYNLKLQNSICHGMHTGWESGINPSTDITVTNCDFYHIKYYAILFYAENKDYPCWRMKVTHCTFDDIQWGRDSEECVGFGGCRDSEFGYNTMTRLGKIGVDFGTCWNCICHHNDIDVTDMEREACGIYVIAGHTAGQTVSDITISNNYVHGNRQCIAFANEEADTTIQHITIENNVIHSTGGYPGIMQFNMNLPNYYSNIYIIHNTMYCPGGAKCISIEASASYMDGLHIANNIFIGSSTNLFRSTTTPTVMTNNIFYNTAGTATGHGTNAYVGNPNLMILGTDYHLTASSTLAIDKGTPTYTTTYDFDEYLRDSQPDIGAYEYYTTSLPPEAPIIDGPASGKVGVSYDYNFFAFDPNGDDVYYRIDWNDGTPITDWIGPYPSGQGVVVPHIFTNTGLMTIRCQAKDSYNSVSDWGQLEVIIPKGGKIYIPLPLLELLERLFERFPTAFPLLRQLMEY